MAPGDGALAMSPWINVREVELAASAVGLGNFDGVHRGHAAVITSLVEASRSKGVPASVLILWPHPRSVLKPSEPQRLLTTLEERGRWLKELGVQGLYLWPFSETEARLSPEAFVAEILLAHLSPKVVAVGENHRFGSRARGTPEDLRRMGTEKGYETLIVPPFEADGGVVSATRIRRLVEAGALEEADRLLGRPYRLEGTVRSGDRRGRTLGFPTANVTPDPEKVWPAFGVYAATAYPGDGTGHQAVVNFGPRPTFDDRVLAEVHLLDFEGDLYGQRLAVDFARRLRGQERFASLGDLVRQISQDVEAARGVLGSGPSGGR